MTATLLLAAHGTRSPAGTATTHRIHAAVAAARRSVPVRLCFLDVAAPSLAEGLDAMPGTDVVVLPLLLSAGYHVRTDIPAVVAGRPSVIVAEHLGPDPAVLAAVADRLGAVATDVSGATVLLAAIASSQAGAREEVTRAAAGLGTLLGRDVGVLALDRLDALAALPGPLAVATYLLAEGGFLDALRAAVASRGVVADPIGAHDDLVRLVWRRYDAAISAADVG